MTSALLQKFKKMLPARSFHSDQIKTSTTTQDQEQSLPDQDYDQNHIYIMLVWDRPHQLCYIVIAQVQGSAVRTWDWTLRALYSWIMDVSG